MLRVHQRVHRVDHQGGYPICRVRLPDEAVHNRKEVAEALAGPRTTRHHEAFVGQRLADGLFLVTIKGNGFPSL
jgi:hypothetical protein